MRKRVVWATHDDAPLVRAASPEPSVETMFDLMNSVVADVADDTEHQARMQSTNPDYHLCVGPSCPHVELNRDATYICRVTGLCYGQHTVNDALTAGQVTHHDENGVRTCGAVAGRRTKGRNSRLASEHAFVAAASMVESDADRDWRPQPIKRRKRAQASEPAGLPKNATRRALDPAQLQLLRSEAERTLDKLTTARAGPSTASAPVAVAVAIAATAGPSSDNDADSCARTHIRRCQIAGVRPQLDDIHNIYWECRNNAAARGRRAEAHQCASRRSKQYCVLRAAGAALVVSLWQCTLRSPYMKNPKRSSVLFKPFAAGVFFSMRLGVEVGPSTLVPECPQLTDALPAVRAAHRGTPTHPVHLSAHRGVCTLQHVISSVPPSETRHFFASAIEAARRLEAECGR